MTLDQWLIAQGTGAAHRLMFRAGVSYPTIRRAREGRAKRESARRIHVATGRKVPISSMTAEPVRSSRA